MIYLGRGSDRIAATGILIATDPLFTALLALWLIRAKAVNRKQLAGLMVGFTGVLACLAWQ